MPNSKLIVVAVGVPHTVLIIVAARRCRYRRRSRVVAKAEVKPTAIVTIEATIVPIEATIIPIEATIIPIEAPVIIIEMPVTTAIVATAAKILPRRLPASSLIAAVSRQSQIRCGDRQT